MDRLIYKTLLYFQHFDYAPTFEELSTFIEKKMSEKNLQTRLTRLVRTRKIKIYRTDNTDRYTLGEYSRNLKMQSMRQKIENSKAKIRSIQTYLSIIARLPQIELVGLSGTVAMMNANETDDIDLFIISGRHRLWTARFLAVSIARIMGIGRKRGDTRGHYDKKICLNLFFDSSHLSIPHKKRSIYTAHEVLQMKPLIDKQNAYGRFLEANSWVFTVFPNAKTYVGSRGWLVDGGVQSKNHRQSIAGSLLSVICYFGDLIESVLSRIQLYTIHKHRTRERITATQLWFHPEDVEKKIRQAQV